MDHRLDKIETKIDGIQDSLHLIHLTLVKQEGNLKDHMRRSEINEENIQLLRQEVRPIQDHVTKLNGVVRLVGLSSIVAALLVSIITMVKELR